MTKVHCPTCQVELMEHEAGECLNEWVRKALGAEYRNNESFFFCSQSNRAALFLMDRVWGMDTWAEIRFDSIAVHGHHGPGGTKITVGHTFPLRVCRAYLLLKIGGLHNASMAGRRERHSEREA